jgi:hypothetical protein
MAKAKSIAPFPSDIDRDAFGHWLSGFTDGEGSFALAVTKCRATANLQPSASFRIGLRADETPILRSIQTFFGCGLLIYNDNVRSKITNAKPVMIFCVQESRDLATVIIPHFERYPLRAKKRADFAIWKQGVTLLATVSKRRSVGRLGIGGFYPKWAPEERARFVSLRTALITQRCYESEPTDQPKREPEATLFD